MITRVHPNNTVFVYGTLCRGQCREHCWPRRPREVIPAVTLGSLYAGNDYPAMRPGDDYVVGECWGFDQSDMAEVLRSLDQIEGTNHPGRLSSTNLYDRLVVEVFSRPREPVPRTNRQRVPMTLDPLGKAQTYFFHQVLEDADSSAHRFKRVQPNESGYVRWPASD